MLFWQVISGVQFKDENMVDPRWPPSVNIESHKEQEYDEEKWATVQSNHDAPIVFHLLVLVADYTNLGLSILI